MLSNVSSLISRRTNPSYKQQRVGIACSILPVHDPTTTCSRPLPEHSYAGPSYVSSFGLAACSGCDVSNSNTLSCIRARVRTGVAYSRQRSTKVIEGLQIVNLNRLMSYDDSTRILPCFSSMPQTCKLCHSWFPGELIISDGSQVADTAIVTILTAFTAKVGPSWFR